MHIYICILYAYINIALYNDTGRGNVDHRRCWANATSFLSYPWQPPKPPEKARMTASMYSRRICSRYVV